MSVRKEQPELPEHDALDHLLSEADFVSLDEARVARLETKWDRITSHRRRRRRAMGASLAVLMCVTLGAAFQFTRPFMFRNRQIAVEPSGRNGLQTPEERAPSRQRDTASDARRKIQEESQQRVFEGAVLAVARRQLRQTRVVSNAQLLEDCLNSLESAMSNGLDESVDVAVVSQPLLDSREYELLLLQSEIWRTHNSPRRRAAVVLLSEIASPRSLPTLLALLVEPNCPDRVSTAVVRLAGDRW